MSSFLQKAKIAEELKRISKLFKRTELAFEDWLIWEKEKVNDKEFDHFLMSLKLLVEYTEKLIGERNNSTNDEIFLLQSLSFKIDGVLNYVGYYPGKNVVFTPLLQQFKKNVDLMKKYKIP